MKPGPLGRAQGSTSTLSPTARSLTGLQCFAAAFLSFTLVWHPGSDDGPSGGLPCSRLQLPAVGTQAFSSTWLLLVSLESSFFHGSHSFFCSGLLRPVGIWPSDILVLVCLAPTAGWKSLDKVPGTTGYPGGLIAQEVAQLRRNRASCGGPAQPVFPSTQCGRAWQQRASLPHPRVRASLLHAFLLLFCSNDSSVFCTNQALQLMPSSTVPRFLISLLQCLPSSTG